MDIHMSELVAAVMMICLAMGLPILLLMAFGIERLVNRFRTWRQTRMPGRIRSLNS